MSGATAPKGHGATGQGQERCLLRAAPAHPACLAGGPRLSQCPRGRGRASGRWLFLWTSAVHLWVLSPIGAEVSASLPAARSYGDPESQLPGSLSCGRLLCSHQSRGQRGQLQRSSRPDRGEVSGLTKTSRASGRRFPKHPGFPEHVGAPRHGLGSLHLAVPSHEGQTPGVTDRDDLSPRLGPFSHLRDRLPSLSQTASELDVLKLGLVV